MKKFLVIGSVVVLLAGCSSLDFKSNIEKERLQNGGSLLEEKPESLAISITPVLSEEEYSEETFTLVKSVGDVAVSYKAATDASNLGEKNWKALFKEDLESYQILYKEFLEKTPPDSYQEIANEVQSLVEKDYNIMSNIIKSITTDDNKLFNLATKELKANFDHWLELSLEIDSTMTIKFGDGTITNKDITPGEYTPDESVYSGVSIDGKELIGKWGNPIESSGVDVSIELNEDGSYYGYPNNTYPSKDNALVGTWIWNHDKKSISFVNDYFYVNGEKSSLNGAVMEFSLLSYDFFDIKLFDLNNWTTFEYSKSLSN